MPPENPSLQSLSNLLQRRLEVIADHDWRDRDSNAHMEALRDVSEGIARCHQSLKGHIPPRLEHFLDNRSLDKALDWLQNADSR